MEEKLFKSSRVETGEEGTKGYWNVDQCVRTSDLQATNTQVNNSSYYFTYELHFNTETSLESFSDLEKGGVLSDMGLKEKPRNHMYPWTPPDCVYVVSFLASLSTLAPRFSSVAQSCPTLCNPMNCSTPGLSVHYKLPEFTQTHVHQVGDAIQPPHPLSSPSPPTPTPSQHQGLFHESTFLMRWPKYWSFTFSICPSNEHLGLDHSSQLKDVSFQCMTKFTTN